MRLVAIDFETANRYPQSACALGVTVFNDGVLEESFGSLIKPHPDFNNFFPGNISIHHITPDMVKDAPEFPAVYAMLLPYLEDAVLTAHNAPFDMGVLKSCCRLYHIPYPTLPYFCTVDVSRKVYPALPHHRLNDMAEYFSISLDHHEASSDARACALIVVNTMNLMQVFDIPQFIGECGMSFKLL